MADLGSVPTVSSETDLEFKFFTAWGYPAFPLKTSDDHVPTRTSLVPQNATVANHSTSVRTYPHTVCTSPNRAPIGNAPSLGRMRKSIRGLTQNAASVGISRTVFALSIDANNSFPPQIISQVLSPITGIFDIRVPTDQLVTLVMKADDGDTKNAVILEDVLPVAAV